MKKSTNRKVDWAVVEADYRAGVKSGKQIARAHGVSQAALMVRATEEGWTQDLSARIRARAVQLLATDANSQRAILLSHQDCIRRLRDLSQRLRDDLRRAPEAGGRSAATRDLAAALADLDALSIKTEQSLKKLDTKADEQADRQGMPAPGHQGSACGS